MLHIFVNIIFLVGLLFTPIRTPIISPRDEDKTPECLEKELAIETCFKLISRDLYDRFGLQVEPIGWASRRPEIYYVTFTTFYLNNINSQDEARALIVKVVSYVLDFLNENPDAIPLLIEHPFSPEKMFFSVKFVDNLMNEEGWGSVNMYRGTVNYTYVYEKIKVPSETFEEAKAKVAANSR